MCFLQSDQFFDDQCISYDYLYRILISQPGKQVYLLTKQVHSSKPKSITMNTTTYWSERQNSFKSNLRRNSLETLNKLKNNLSHQKQEPLLKSLTSFDKLNKIHRNELPQIRYEKQMDNNIYFNPHSRNNYFKNLIDSYFNHDEPHTKPNQNFQKPSKNFQNTHKPSYLLRRTVLTKKNTFKELVQNRQKLKDKSPLLTPPTQTQPNKSNFSILNKERIGKRSVTKHQILTTPKTNLYKIPPSDQKDQMMEFVQSGPLSAKQHFQQINFCEQSFLRKITQAIDDQDFDEETQINSRQQLLNTTFMRSQSNFSRLQDKKVLVYENSVIKLFTSWENEKKYRIKQFKNNVFLKRHNRALECGAYSFWKSYKFNQMSLIIPYLFPLKDYLFKLLPHPTSPEYYIVQPKPFYYRMTANHCQELFLLFREFIKDVHKISRKVLNNKINLSNLFYVNGKFSLGEWEYSAFKEENKIQGNHFQSRVEPILKCDQQWLVSPEYLAPQILESIQDTYKSFDLWEYQNSSDIYSIGLTFLEIITLIPMWMQQRASVKSKIMKPRDGLLSTPNRSAPRILEKQKLLASKMTTFLEREVGQDEQNWRFFNILIKMIEPNRSKRITIDQLVKQIQ